MRRFVVPMVLGMALCPALLFSQECKLKFAVAYTDGKTVQVGMTEEQAKFWKHDGAKKFKGMCLDAEKPDYIVLWSEGLQGGELVEGVVANFNRGRATGENTTGAMSNLGSKGSTTDSRWMQGTAFIRPSGAVKAKADYWILDTSKTPYPMIRKGQGYQDVPKNTARANQPGESINSSDFASTIADPAVALENALKWLKKEKKL